MTGVRQAWDHMYWDCRKPAPSVSLAELEEGQGLAMLVENWMNWKNSFSAEKMCWSVGLGTAVVVMKEVFPSRCSHPIQDFLKPFVNHEISESMIAAHFRGLAICRTRSRTTAQVHNSIY